MSSAYSFRTFSYWLYWKWDWVTSMEEVMNGLHNLVTSGKVLYLVRFTTPGPHHYLTNEHNAGHF